MTGQTVQWLGSDLEDRGIRVWFLGQERDCPVLHGTQTSSEAHWASYAMGAEGSFSGGLKELGHEADHSPTPSAKVKDTGVYFHLIY
jgi:hypothetical protein